MTSLWNYFEQAVSQASNLRDHRFTKFYGIWIVILASTAWLSQGWIQPDEQARVLEPAHFIAYGYASLPWEMNSNFPIVSWFLGYLVCPIFFTSKIFSLSGITEAAIARFAIGLFSSTKFFALWHILDLVKVNPKRKPTYLVICMLCLFGPMFLVRTSQETFAVTFLLWAFYLALKLRQDGLKFSRIVLFGLLLALTASSRPQVGVAAAGLGFWLLFQMGPPIIFPSFIGLILGLAPMAFIDFQTTGTPFLPAYNYLRYALGDEDGGRVWGTSPWWFYVQQYFEIWYPPVSIFLLVPLVVGLIRNSSIAFIFIPFAIVHMILGHKEARYFSPMIPFMQLASFIGWEQWEGTSNFISNFSKKTKFWSRTIKAVVALTLLSSFIPINSSPQMYHRLGEKIRSGEIQHFTYIGNTMTGISLFFAKLPEPPDFTQISWNDLKSGAYTPQGWLAFYALDPDDFKIIEQKCQIEHLQIYPKWYISALRLMPKSPARRKLNPIIYCKDPLILTIN